jgi:hypothetical protein
MVGACLDSSVKRYSITDRMHTNAEQKRIGALNWTQLWEGLVGLSLRLYIDILGWSREELEMLLFEVRQDLRNPNIHAMFDLYALSNRNSCCDFADVYVFRYTVWGQRPGN